MIWLAGKAGPYDLPVVLAAFIFSVMHLSLLTMGVDVYTLLIILVFTFALGLYAGRFRQTYRSIWPAFWIHLAFNVGGVLTAIIYNITQL